MFYIFSLLIVSVTFLYSEGKYENYSNNKKYNLSICTLFKNEAKNLREWIEYHQLVGVEHFYLYNNGSSDRYMSVLKPYIKRGVVTLIQWPDQMAFQNKDSDEIWAICTQISAYENAARYKAIDETRWLAFVHVNEFLVPQSVDTMTELLERFKDKPAIRLIDKYYDASNIRPKLPPRRLLIETVELTKDPGGPKEKMIVKTIFKPDQVKYFRWAPFEYIFKDDNKAFSVEISEAHINQYVHRDVGYQGRVKSRISLGYKSISNEEKKEILENDYEIDDQEKVISRFIPEVTKRMGLDPYIPGSEIESASKQLSVER